MNAEVFSRPGAAVEASATERASSRPTLLFVSRKWLPAVGGMETYSVKLSAELEKHAEVERIVLKGRTDGGAPGLGAVLAFGARAAIGIVFRRSAPDIVHVADMSSWPLGLVARLRSRRSRIVLSAHGTDVAYPDRPGPIPRLYGAYMRLGGRIGRDWTVIANSRATKAKADALGFAATETVPLATDMNGPAVADRPGGASKTILFAGRLLPAKGCRWFIENVLPELPEGTKLKVAGTVWDAGEEAALSAPRVEFLGALAPEDLARAYREADCVIVPNIFIDGGGFEGFGLVAAEAAAAGGLVLAASHTGLKDAVLDGETGLQLPPGDVSAWVSTLHDVLGWPEDKRRAFLENAAATARRHYSWERVGRDTFEAYNRSA